MTPPPPRPPIAGCSAGSARTSRHSRAQCRPRRRAEGGYAGSPYYRRCDEADARRRGRDRRGPRVPTSGGAVPAVGESRNQLRGTSWDRARHLSARGGDGGPSAEDTEGRRAAGDRSLLASEARSAAAAQVAGPDRPRRARRRLSLAVVDLHVARRRTRDVRPPRRSDPDCHGHGGIHRRTSAHRPRPGPTPGPDNSWRGVPLAMRDEQTRASIDALAVAMDIEAVTAVWDEAVDAPEWKGPACWLHGDLDSRNLIARGGRLHGVIDWGCLVMGDPACDVMVAWKMLTGEAREQFRSASRSMRRPGLALVVGPSPGRHRNCLLHPGNQCRPGHGGSTMDGRGNRRSPDCGLTRPGRRSRRAAKLGATRLSPSVDRVAFLA